MLKIIVTEILKKTFGNNLCNLTLVCIPASTLLINNARYEEFSYRICTSLGMHNAFPYIHIVKEKSPKHLGGTGHAVINFDSEFFVGKNVLLFDDIITKGDSMYDFQRKMIALRANVIAGLSIGKTRHERNSDPMCEFLKGSFNS